MRLRVTNRANGHSFDIDIPADAEVTVVVPVQNLDDEQPPKKPPVSVSAEIAHAEYMNATLNCNGSGPHMPGEVRKLPTGSGGNMILCRNCWVKEIAYRASRNRELGPSRIGSAFALVPWEKGQVYEA